MQTLYVLHSSSESQSPGGFLRRELHRCSELLCVLVALFFNLLSQFLKVLPKTAPGAAAGEEGKCRKKKADALEFVHGRVSRGRVMGENGYLTTRALMAQANACRRGYGGLPAARFSKILPEIAQD